MKLAVGANTFGQMLNFLFIEFTTRLLRVGNDPVDFDFAKGPQWHPANIFRRRHRTQFGCSVNSSATQRFINIQAASFNAFRVLAILLYATLRFGSSIPIRSRISRARESVNFAAFDDGSWSLDGLSSRD